MNLIEQIKERLDIVTALQQYTSADLTRLRGKKGNIPCPFHEDKHPSFTIDTVGNRYYCHSCGAKGDVINLYAETHGVNNKDAIKMLAKELGVTDGKISKEYKIQYKKKKKEKEVVTVVKKDIDRVYIELCEIYHVIQDFISKANSMDDLYTIQIFIDEQPKIVYLLDSLQNPSDKDEYLKSYVLAKGVVQKWKTIFKSII